MVTHIGNWHSPCEAYTYDAHPDSIKRVFWPQRTGKAQTHAKFTRALVNIARFPPKWQTKLRLLPWETGNEPKAVDFIVSGL